MKKNKTQNRLITRHTLRENDNLGQKQISDKPLTLNSAQILLVEDNATNQMVATAMLEKINCLVTPAGNGREAVDLVKERNFDLIFMDCNMPEMDGFEATKNIRKYEESLSGKKTPIIALTAYAMKGDDNRCFEAGMDDYIAKPVKKIDISRAITKWLPHKIAKDESLQDSKLKKGKVTKKSKPNKKAIAKNLKELSIDQESLEEIKYILKDNFSSFVNKYLENSVELIEKSIQHNNNDNYEELNRSMHMLKSSSGSIGASYISDLAKELEEISDHAMKGEKIDSNSMNKKIKTLKAAFTKIKPVIEKEISA